MDIEDAHKLRLLSYEETERLLLGFFAAEEQEHIRQRMVEEQLDDLNERVVYMRASAIGRLEGECVRAFVDNEGIILAGDFEGSLVEAVSPAVRYAYRRCAEVSRKRIYRSKPVLDVELSGYKIMATLMEQMVDAVLHPDRYYSRQLIGRVSSQYDIASPDLETRLMAVIDYISGMTDIYALDVYQKMMGMALPIV